LANHLSPRGPNCRNASARHDFFVSTELPPESWRATCSLHDAEIIPFMLGQGGPPMMKWMTAAVVALSVMSISWMPAPHPASAAQSAAATPDESGESDAALQHRQCLPNHWRSYVLQF
jgi:hypothetical protein